MAFFEIVQSGGTSYPARSTYTYITGSSASVTANIPTNNIISIAALSLVVINVSGHITIREDSLNIAGCFLFGGKAGMVNAASLSNISINGYEYFVVITASSPITVLLDA